MFAIAGMGALFAATVRAPITGVLLVIEMTNNYHLILPLIITTLGATMLAQVLGGQPIYSQLLRRKMEKEKKLPKESSLKWSILERDSQVLDNRINYRMCLRGF